MLVRVPKGWETPERSAAPEEVFKGRRKFLQGAAGTLAGLGVAGIGAKWWLDMFKPDVTAAAQALPKIAAERNLKYGVDRPFTPESIVAHYNNFYEFTTDKERVAELAANFPSRPWEIQVSGEVEKPIRIDVDRLIAVMPLEERVYRHRCVEAWSIVVPWIGFPLADFVKWAKPTSQARYLRMVSFLKPNDAVGQKTQDWYPWPYFEGLTMAEATNELSLLVVGSYGHRLPNQNGAPLRLAVPWKYGYKSIKSIVHFEFTRTQPRTFWNQIAPNEYGFTSNVDPTKPHPRWSQATERDMATGNRIPTRLYNGYGEYVSSLYA